MINAAIHDYNSGMCSSFKNLCQVSTFPCLKWSSYNKRRLIESFEPVFQYCSKHNLPQFIISYNEKRKKTSLIKPNDCCCQAASNNVDVVTVYTYIQLALLQCSFENDYNVFYWFSSVNSFHKIKALTHSEIFHAICSEVIEFYPLFNVDLITSNQIINQSPIDLISDYLKSRSQINGSESSCRI